MNQHHMTYHMPKRASHLSTRSYCCVLLLKNLTHTLAIHDMCDMTLKANTSVLANRAVKEEVALKGHFVVLEKKFRLRNIDIFHN